MSTPQELREQITRILNPYVIHTRLPSLDGDRAVDKAFIEHDIAVLDGLVKQVSGIVTQALHRQDVESKISEWDLIGDTLYSATIASELHIKKVRDGRVKELSDSLKNTKPGDV